MRKIKLIVWALVLSIFFTAGLAFGETFTGPIILPNTTIYSNDAYIGPHTIIQTEDDADNVLSSIWLWEEKIRFGKGDHENFQEFMQIRPDGKVTIGQVDGGYDPDCMLAVKGTIKAGKVIVEDVSQWPDYVFRKGYALPSLEKVETYIKENKHLPDIPSENEIKENGLSISDMMAKQMQKIEELTLYLIDMKNENEKIKQKNNELTRRIAALEKK